VVTRLAILGATGSIGRQGLDVVRSHRDRLRVTALASAHSAPELEALATETGAATVLQERDGDDALCDLVTRADVDLVLVATPGIAGLAPTLAALRAGKRVALANKEVLVTGGHLVAALAGGAGDRLRPVDSEHCALWQCLVGERMENVARVAVTASGGPFRERPLGELASVTPDEALRHPTWKMGPKVTIDSATLANKGYEVVETHWLYGIPYQRIDIVVHPESVIHALVEFTDGSVKAQLAEPDMRLPIQYALLWDRAPSPAAVHCSICKSPSELPNAAMGLRPMCMLIATGLPTLSSMKFNSGSRVSTGPPGSISNLVTILLPTTCSGGIPYIFSAKTRINSTPPPETTNVLNPWERK